MDLTREDAIRLHRWMWNDMRKALGDCPDDEAREAYKEKWCSQHGFNNVKHNCFLCEYSYRKSPHFCEHCPVKWPTCNGICIDNVSDDESPLRGDYYQIAPIREIIALPEREDV